MLWAGATASAKQVTAISGLGAETPALVTLGTAIDLGEFLTVVLTFAPTTGRARLVAGRALPFRVAEVVRVQPLGPLAGDDFFPINGAHVAQIVVIDHAHIAGQNICGNRNAKS